MNKLKQHKIELLIEAKRHIATGCEDYICHAIQKAEGSYFVALSPTTKAGKALVKYIEDALAPQGEFEDWQRARGLFKGHVQVREDRVAWIDWMLKSLKGCV